MNSITKKIVAGNSKTQKKYIPGLSRKEDFPLYDGMIMDLTCANGNGTRQLKPISSFLKYYKSNKNPATKFLQFVRTRRTIVRGMEEEEFEYEQDTFKSVMNIVQHSLNWERRWRVPKEYYYVDAEFIKWCQAFQCITDPVGQMEDLLDSKWPWEDCCIDDFLNVGKITRVKETFVVKFHKLTWMTDKKRYTYYDPSISYSELTYEVIDLNVVTGKATIIDCLPANTLTITRAIEHPFKVPDLCKNFRKKVIQKKKGEKRKLNKMDLSQIAEVVSPPTYSEIAKKNHRLVRNQMQAGHFHSVYCIRCHGVNPLYLSPRLNFRQERDKVRSLYNGKLYPSTTEIQEIINDHASWIRQSTTTLSPPSGIIRKMSELLVEQITARLNNWDAGLVVVGAASALVATVGAVVSIVLDLWMNGVNTCRVISLILSLVSLASQICMLVGAANLAQSVVGDLTPMLTEALTSLTESPTLSQLNVPIIQNVVANNNVAEPITSTATVRSPLKPLSENVPVKVNVITNVELLRALKHASMLSMKGDGLCGYAAITYGAHASMTPYELLVDLYKHDERVRKRVGQLPKEALTYPDAVHFDEVIAESFVARYGINLRVYSADDNTITSFTAEKKSSFAKTINLYLKSKHYSLVQFPSGELQASVPSLDTFITGAISTLTICLSLCGLGGASWVKGFSNHIITARKLKEAVKADVNDARELIDAVAEDCFDLKLSTFSKTMATIRQINSTLDDFMKCTNVYYCQNPYEYFKFRNALMDAENVLMSSRTQSSKTPTGLVTAYSLLSANVMRAKSQFLAVARTVTTEPVKVEPPFINFVGLHGAGKTFFITHWLIPRIAKLKGWSDTVYSLNFGGQEYFPPYSGSEICFYDELFNRRGDDPLIEHINGICSTGAYNIPGADLPYKQQPCLFKLLLTASNVHFVSMKNTVLDETQRALYSRMHRIEVSNIHVNSDTIPSRDDIPHSEDYSELEFRWFKNPPSEVSKIQLGKYDPASPNRADPFEVISKEEVLNRIIELINKKEREFHSIYSRPIHAPESNSPSQRVPNMDIFPGGAASITPSVVAVSEQQLASVAVTRHNNRILESFGNPETMGDLIDELEDFLNTFPVEVDKLTTDKVIHYKTILNAILTKDYDLDTNGRITLLVESLRKNTYFSSDTEFMSGPIVDWMTSQQSLVSDHLVVLLSGETASGKSTLARRLGARLANLFRMPLVEVTTQTLVKVHVSEPSVVVLHDKVNDEQLYINFYDALPQPSIIINTNNLRFYRKRRWRYGGVPLPKQPRSTVQWVRDSVVNALAPLPWAYCSYTHIETHSACTPESGFARRVGLPGYVYHAGDFHYRSPDTTEHWHVEKFGRLLPPISRDVNREQTLEDLLVRVTNKYRDMKRELGDICFVEDNTLDLNGASADVHLVFKDIAQCKEYVNNPALIMSAFYNGLDGTKKAPSVHISDRVQHSTFYFSPTMFRITKTDDLEGVKEMATQAFRLLLEGNSKFTCILDIGDEFRAYCEKGIINWRAGAKLRKDVEYFSHSLEERVVDGKYDYDCVVNVHGKNEKQVVIPVDSLFATLYGGIQCDHDGIITVSMYEYLYSQLTTFENDKRLQSWTNSYRIQRVAISQMKKEVPIFLTLWQSLTQGPFFKVILGLCALSLALVSLSSIAGLFSMFRRSAVTSEVSSTSKDKVKEYSVPLHSQIIRLKPMIKNKVVSFEATATDEFPIEDLRCFIDDIVTEDFSGHVLGDITVKYRQSDLKSSRKFGKGKNLARAPIRKIVGGKEQTSSLRTDSTLAIIKKIYDAQCWVTAGNGSACYGLRWKDFDVLTPAHMWKHVGEKGRVNCLMRTRETAQLGKTVIGSVEAMVYFIDEPNDIACCRLTSASTGDYILEPSKNLTKYFHRELDLVNRSTAAILTRNTSGRIRSTGFHQSAQVIIEGMLTIVNRISDKPTDSGKRVSYFRRIGAGGITTASGDCGSVYIITDPSAGAEIIAGLHINLRESKNESFANAISQEYLEQIRFVEIGENQAGNEFSAVPLLKHIAPDGKAEDFGVEHIVDEYYDKWFDSLEDVLGDSDVFYDAESNPDANLYLIGFDRACAFEKRGKPSHSLTPWVDEILDVLPLSKVHSVTHVSQHSSPEILPKIRGKHSVLGLQLSYYNDKCVPDKELYDLLDESVPYVMAQYRRVYTDPLRVLSDLETINGLYFTRQDPLYGYLSPIDQDTSAGDYVLRKYGFTNKERIFEKIECPNPTQRDMYDFANSTCGRDMQWRCSRYEDAAHQRSRVILPMRDALKYELVEKENKSRLFTVCSFEETFFGRKYTGALQACFAKNWYRGHCQVGIDPVPGFHELYNRFSQVSQYGEAGDFSRWDKHTLAPCLWRGFCIMRDLYLDHITSEHSRRNITNAFAVMADSMINSVSIADGVAYLKVRGMPSGCPTTAVLNSIVNDILTVASLRWIATSHNQLLKTLSVEERDQRLLATYGKEFDARIRLMRESVNITSQFLSQFVDWATYGDDVVTIISPKYIWLFNFMSRRKFFTTVMRINYDSPEKDGVLYLYRQLPELSFLSRTFSQIRGLTFPALKKASVESLLHYSRKQGVMYWEANIRDCMAEACLHGPEYYEFIQSVIRRILRWGERNGVAFDKVVLDTVDERMNWATQVILEGKRRKILPKQPSEGLEFEIDNCPEYIDFPRSLIDPDNNQSCISESEMFDHTDVSSFATLAARADQLLLAVDLDGAKVLSSYHPYPAVLQYTDRVRLSVCFKGTTYQITDMSNVRSDISTYLLPALAPVECTYQNVTICYRRLSASGAALTPVWQITFNVADPDSTQDTARENNPTRLKRVPTTILHSGLQATGTEARATVQERIGGEAADRQIVPLSKGYGVKKSDIKDVLWHQNMKDVAYDWMQTTQVPIAIDIGTPAGTVIFKRTLSAIDTMAPAMKAWARINTWTNCSRCFRLKFITAATLVNEIIVGISTKSKTTYTVQELQLIDWVALNAQDMTLELELHLADVAWGGVAGSVQEITHVNRYRVVETDTGTDADPTNIPTLVIMTRVGIQNSYDNNNLSIFIAEEQKFGPGQWLVDGPLLNSYLTDASESRAFSAAAAETLSKFLNVFPGRPLYITCDGGVLPSQRADLTRDMEAKTTWSSMASGTFNYMVTADFTNFTDLQVTATVTNPGGSMSVLIPVITSLTSYSQHGIGVNSFANMSNFVQQFELVTKTDDPWTTNNKQIAQQVLYNSANGIISIDTNYRNERLSSPAVPLASIMAVSLTTSGIPEYTFDMPAVPNDLSDDGKLEQLENLALELFSNVLSVNGANNYSVYTVPTALTTWELASTISPEDDDATIEFSTLTAHWGPGGTGVIANRTAKAPATVITPTIQVCIEAGGASKTYRVLFAWFDNDVNDCSIGLKDVRTSFSPWPATETMDYPAPLGMQGVVRRRYKITSGSEILTGTITNVTRDTVATLDSFTSRVSFPMFLPKAIPPAIADTGVPVEFDDEYFITMFQNKMRQLDIVSTPEDQVVTMNLYVRATTNVVITLVYDPAAVCFYVYNNPTTTSLWYRTLRKLTYEEVLINNVRAVNRYAAGIASTDTSRWIDRVTDVDSRVFNGVAMLQSRNILPNGHFTLSSRLMRSTKPRAITRSGQQAAAAAELAVGSEAGSGAMSGIGGTIVSGIGGLISQIGQYFVQKDLMNQQLQNLLKVVEAQGQQIAQQIQQQADAQMAQLKYKYEQENQELKQQLASAQQIAAQNNASQEAIAAGQNQTSLAENTANLNHDTHMKIDQSGLAAGLSARTNHSTQPFVSGGTLTPSEGYIDYGNGRKIYNRMAAMEPSQTTSGASDTSVKLADASRSGADSIATASPTSDYTSNMDPSVEIPEAINHNSISYGSGIRIRRSGVATTKLGEGETSIPLTDEDFGKWPISERVAHYVKATKRPLKSAFGRLIKS